MIIAQASKTRIENPPVIGRFSGIQTRCQHRSSAQRDRSRRHNQSLGCDAGGGFTGVTTCGGSGVIVRSVVLASRLVHAGIATSMASQRICIDPRTLLRLPISLCLEVLDCRFSLRGSHLPIETFSGFAECRVTCQRTFGAGKTNPRNKDQRRSGYYRSQHAPDERR